jgi:hypothetical protein
MPTLCTVMERPYIQQRPRKCDPALRNWQAQFLFCDTAAGANAKLYSLIETCKEYQYLITLFKALSIGNTADDYERCWPGS